MQEIGLDCGLVDNKVCAIDDTWSGLRFVGGVARPPVVERALTADSMCGRYVQVSSPTLLVERFDVDEIVVPEPPEADYNVAPRNEVLTVVQREPGRSGRRRRGPGSGSSSRCAGAWCPSWADDPKIGDRLINARAESLAEKAGLQDRVPQAPLHPPGRRVLRVADGSRARSRSSRCSSTAGTGSRSRSPGLWEVWKDHTVPDAPWLLSCAIVTTRANETDGADPRPHAGDAPRGRVGHVARRPRNDDARRARAAARARARRRTSSSGR